MHELIADMPIDERPRERMLTHGATSLCNAEQLAKRDGIGIAKATRILSAFEIARRVACHRPEKRPLFDTDVFGRGFIARSRALSQERLGALLLDSRRHILRERELFIGSVTRALVSTRE